MAGGASRYRDVFLVGVCLLVPAVVLYANSRPAAEAGPVVRAVVALTAPLQDGVTRAVGSVSDAWERHWQDAATLEEARELRLELTRLRREAERLEELQRENQRLRDLLGAAPLPGGPDYAAARVVAVGASAAWRTVRIDTGRSAGVERGMAVVAAEGAVGSVLRTGHGYADVMLLSDPRASVDVVLPRTGARGILRGTGSDRGPSLQVEGLERELDVREGDEVVASGLGARFPRGTHIGRVVSVHTAETSLTSTAEVQPAVGFARLRDVLVIRSAETMGSVFLGPALPPGGLPAPETPAGPPRAPAPSPAPEAAPPPDTPVPQESVAPGGKP
ncbi:MAG: rod shape-determining protein MreC [Deltaproteobacteria bacterium]|nr:rod shape-determining protein MreC [Deltaproteobacteria bacterium]